MTPSAAVKELAELRGVQSSFEGGDGRAHEADEDVLLAILAALGSPVGSANDAVAALADARRAAFPLGLEPILVHRIGRRSSATLRVPDAVDPRDVWCTIEFEDGRVGRQRLTSGLTSMSAGSGRPGERVKTYVFTLQPDGTEPIPPGYHGVTVEWPGADTRARLIAAPTCPLPSRGWGVFLPLHAVRTDDDWGVGSYGDLVTLGRWVGGLGGSAVGALPLYPAFLEPPADPSPYLPVSRLAYNEIFIDPTALPELTQAPEARRLLDADGFRRRLASVHRSELVDYEEVARLRREVLAPMAEALLAGDTPRRAEFCAFVQDHPELLAYARFRAGRDALRLPEATDRTPTTDRPPTLAYHLYTQWAAAEQLTAAARATPLYADLPIGVHPDGFDPQWAPESFVPKVHGGAPPDLFFEGGQDWSFPPLHPGRIRTDGYRYVIETLRRAFRHAACLRVDHVMGLQRLYWIPEGFDARHGAYVSYRADELHAVVSLEAFRAGTVVVGEDLGTVPASVRTRMAEDHMLRSWVLQFESTEEEPLPAPPEQALASWGTHDLARFTSYFWGDDIEEHEHMGYLTATEARAQEAARARWREALLRAIGDPTDPTEPTDPAPRALRACLSHLAASRADLVMVDLEELWGEREPQNRPGTGPEARNWSRRASRTLHQAADDGATAAFLASLTALRLGREESPLAQSGVAP